MSTVLSRRKIWSLADFTDRCRPLVDSALIREVVFAICRPLLRVRSGIVLKSRSVLANTWSFRLAVSCEFHKDSPPDMSSLVFFDRVPVNQRCVPRKICLRPRLHLCTPAYSAVLPAPCGVVCRQEEACGETSLPGPRPVAVSLALRREVEVLTRTAHALVSVAQLSIPINKVQAFSARLDSYLVRLRSRLP